MTERQTVLFDADNVLFDFNASFRQYMQKELGLQLPNNPLVDYYPAEVLGKSREWEVGVLSAFQESEYFENLAPTPHAVSAIKRLQEARCSMAVITACGHPGLNMTKITEKRIKNLRQHFGKAAFKEVHIVPAGESKLSYLKQYSSGYWAEDSVRNALDGHNVGHRSFVVDWGHNRHEKTNGLARIKDLRPLVRHALRGTYPTKHQDGFVLRK